MNMRVTCAECGGGAGDCECPEDLACAGLDEDLAYGFHVEEIDEDGYVEQVVD